MNALKQTPHESQYAATGEPTVTTVFDNLQSALAELNMAIRTQTKTNNTVQSLNTKANESVYVVHTIEKKIDHLLTDHLLSAKNKNPTEADINIIHNGKNQPTAEQSAITLKENGA